MFLIAPPHLSNCDLYVNGQRRALDCMVDRGVDGICILANYSGQFLLSDGVRDTLLELCRKHVDDRVPVIVSCGHFSTRLAVERAGMAATAGARMLMLMPPRHGMALRVDEQGIFEVSVFLRLPCGIEGAYCDARSQSYKLPPILRVTFRSKLSDSAYTAERDCF
jgi:hypothetical protein